MSDPRYGFAGELNEAMEHRTQEPHEHCWHDRSYRGPHMDWVSEYRQCCRCDVTPEQPIELPPITCGQTVGPGVTCDRPSLHKGSCSE